MASQIVLAWTVPVAGSSFGPTQAAAALAAVSLYHNDNTDPVLGQFFGLTVDDDQTTSDADSATRTLTLNMVADAPPAFPCHPRTSTPPVLPFLLREARTLPGSFFVTNGLLQVDTTASQLPSVSIGDLIQFMSQQGVFYEVAAVSSTAIDLTAVYTGTTGNTTAFKEVPAPVTIAAVYSSSELDTNGVATVPVIQPGPGARTLTIEYTDSTGNQFAATCALTGKRPAAVVLDPASDGIYSIDEIEIDTVGAFGNTVGQLTLVALSEALPALPPGLPLGTGIGPAETTTGREGTIPPRTFKTMTDEAQLLIDRHLAYLPPSYFALSQQQLSFPALEGDFIVTTGSVDVPTTEDQSGGEINDGDFIEFAIQAGTRYEVESVTDKIVRLVTPFLGIDTNNTGLINTPVKNMMGSKGNIGPSLIEKPTGARLVDPINAGEPVNEELSIPLGQIDSTTSTMVAAPPPNPPLPPAAVPVQQYLSDHFTQTLQLALAGVPIVAEPISFII